MSKKPKKLVGAEKRFKGGWKAILYPNVSNVDKVKFPYYVKLELSNGEIVTEKVADKKDEKRLKKLFPDFFIVD